MLEQLVENIRNYQISIDDAIEQIPRDMAVVLLGELISDTIKQHNRVARSKHDTKES